MAEKKFDIAEIIEDALRQLFVGKKIVLPGRRKARHCTAVSVEGCDLECECRPLTFTLEGGEEVAVALYASVKVSDEVTLHEARSIAFQATDDARRKQIEYADDEARRETYEEDEEV